MSGPNSLSLAALSLALVALVFGLVGMGGDSEGLAKEEEVRQLRAKVDRLEKRLVIAEERESNAVVETPVDTELSDQSLNAENASQLAFANQLKDLGVLEYFEKRREKISEDYEMVLDAEGEMWTRLKALASLQEAGAVDDEVVAAVLPLWEESFEDEAKGGHTRWYLLEGLRGTTNAEFRTQVLDWIGTEESPKMRGQGVQALIPMLPDPNVEEWLRHLAETDPEEGVRNAAARGLENLP